MYSPVIDASVERRSLWQRFVAANRRISDRHFAPRLYPVSHLSALDHWFSHWIGSPAFPADHDAFLEFGCGKTFHFARRFQSRFRSCSATDIEDIPEASVPAGVTFRRCTPEALPFPDGMFDVVVIRSVLEHVEDPQRVFGELARVLKTGGWIFLNLPNKWDYAAVAARLAGSMKSRVLRTCLQIQWQDFPVVYRCNTKRDLTHALRSTDLRIHLFRPLPSEPAYLKFFVPLYLMGAIYQFAVSLFSIDVLQPAFIVVLRKGATDGAARGIEPPDRARPAPIVSAKV